MQDKDKGFTFDEVFDEKATNIKVFDKVGKQLILNLVNGYNSTALAYGVTGTGKTHTIFGDIYNESTKEKGLSLFSIDYLFDQIKSLKQNKKFKIIVLSLYKAQLLRNI